MAVQFSDPSITAPSYVDPTTFSTTLRVYDLTTDPEKTNPIHVHTLTAEELRNGKTLQNTATEITYTLPLTQEQAAHQFSVEQEITGLTVKTGYSPITRAGNTITAEISNDPHPVLRIVKLWNEDPEIEEIRAEMFLKASIPEREGTILHRPETDHPLLVTFDYENGDDPEDLANKGTFTVEKKSYYSAYYDLVNADPTVNYVFTEHPIDGWKCVLEKVEYDPEHFVKTKDAQGNETVHNVYKYVFRNIPVGNVSVTKKVAGDGLSQKERERTFRFRITLSDNTFSDTCETAISGGASGEETSAVLTFSDGAAEFSLTDGQTITIKGLPAKLRYQIEELNPENAEVTMEDAAGTVTKGSEAEGYSVTGFVKFKETVGVTFENKLQHVPEPEPEPEPEKPPKDNTPKTGDASDASLWIALSAGSAAAAWILLVLRRKKKT